MPVGTARLACPYSPSFAANYRFGSLAVIAKTAASQAAG
jgi:hypothetical protein